MPLLINRRGQRNLFATSSAAHLATSSADAASEGQQEPHYVDADNDEFESSLDDVLAAKQALMMKGNLPVELADMIMDFAEYWACSVSRVDYSPLPRGSLLILGGNDPSRDSFLIRTLPLGLTRWTPEETEAWRSAAPPQILGGEFPADRLQALTDDPQHMLISPCRKIVFKIRSCDQGWGGDPQYRGSYNDSWTWFDAGLERFDSSLRTDIVQSSIRPVWPTIAVPAPGQEADWTPQYQHDLLPSPEHCIQRNKTATSDKQDHTVVWKSDDDIDAGELDASGRGSGTGNGEFVRNLKLGDIVTVWGRARFGGWTNEVDYVEVKVYWAV